MKTALKEIWEFYKKIHSGSEEGSAKRFYGGIIIVALLVAFYLFGKEVFPQTVWISMRDTFEYLFLIGATLIGLGVIQEGIKRWTDKDKPPTKSEQ